MQKTVVILALILFFTLAVPSYALTPAGTVIENYATLTWDGGFVVSNVASLTVAQVGGVSLSPAFGSYAAKVGTTFNLSLVLTNRGNGPDSYALTAVSARNWGLVYSSYVGVLAQDGTQTIPFSVRIPRGAAEQTDTLTLTARSLVDGSALAVGVYTLTAKRWGGHK